MWRSYGGCRARASFFFLAWTRSTNGNPASKRHYPSTPKTIINGAFSRGIACKLRAMPTTPLSPLSRLRLRRGNTHKTKSDDIIFVIFCSGRPRLILKQPRTNRHPPPYLMKSDGIRIIDTYSDGEITPRRPTHSPVVIRCSSRPWGNSPKASQLSTQHSNTAIEEAQRLTLPLWGPIVSAVTHSLLSFSFWGWDVVCGCGRSGMRRDCCINRRIRRSAGISTSRKPPFQGGGFKTLHPGNPHFRAGAGSQTRQRNCATLGEWKSFPASPCFGGT